MIWPYTYCMFSWENHIYTHWRKNWFHCNFAMGKFLKKKRERKETFKEREFFHFSDFWTWVLWNFKWLEVILLLGFKDKTWRLKKHRVNTLPIVYMYLPKTLKYEVDFNSINAPNSVFPCWSDAAKNDRKLFFIENTYAKHTKAPRNEKPCGFLQLTVKINIKKLQNQCNHKVWCWEANIQKLHKTRQTKCSTSLLWRVFLFPAK